VELDSQPQDRHRQLREGVPEHLGPTPAELRLGSTFYAKLTTALAGGTGPCVTQNEYSELPQYIAAHDFVNIAQYVSGYQKDYPAWVWGQVSQGSAVYAIPRTSARWGSCTSRRF